MDYSVSHHYLTAEADENDAATPVAPTSAQTEFNSALRAALLSSPASPNADALSAALARTPVGEAGGAGFSAADAGLAGASPRARSAGSRVLSFREVDADHDERDPLSPLALGSSLAALDSDTMRPASARAKLNRQIPSAPTRILDAPDIVDDYYLNLISWSDSNLLAVALGPSVYTWNADTNSVQLLCQLENGDIVTSVSWMPKATGRSDCLAVGCNSSIVQLWDATSLKLIRTMTGHSARVASLSWNPSHRHVISSGGRDSIILNHDVRAPEHAVSTFVGHRQEVCGLRWSLDGTTLASGGNENFLCLWESAMGSRSNPAGEVSPRLVLNDHNAAVKALAWAPFQRSLLASGGGTADRTIKFWLVSASGFGLPLSCDCLARTGEESD
jgi:cell division cycle protein 20 (cofactor of APC complex)